MKCHIMLQWIMICYEMPWYTVIWLCYLICYDRLCYDMFWDKKIYDAQLLRYDLMVRLWKKWFCKVLYTHITKNNTWERNEGCLAWFNYNGKCWDLIHNCIFTSIIHLFYDKYGRVHYEMKMIIKFIMMLWRSLFSLVVGQQH